MKSFDHPYINDSPLDLSGREGAECCDECTDADIQEQQAILNDIDAVIEQVAKPVERCFADVLNQWTDTVLAENAKTSNTDVILVLTRLGVLGQRLIYEANAIGMSDTVKMVKGANNG